MTNALYDSLFGANAGKEKPFLHFADGSCLTHAAFVKVAAKLAHVLVENGLRPGDRLAMQAEKSAEALAIYAACVQAGVVFLPLNTAYTVDELTYFIENSGARLVICDERAQFALLPVVHRFGAELATLNANGSGSVTEHAQNQPDELETVPSTQADLAAFLYTSGTTGRSKGAMLTHANLLSNAAVLAEHWRFSENDKLLHALPIFHTHGLFVATNISLLTGGSMIFLPKFDVDAIVDLMPQATEMMGAPTCYTRLLDDPRLTPDLTRHMRLFVSGSAPLLAETHQRFERRTGHRILERYGMTETNMNTSNPYDGARRAGTVGFPLPGVELKVTDPDTGDSLPDGDVGQIEVRGDNVFQGYWEMPD